MKYRAINGARHSIRLSSFLTSTGVPSLDSLIGGGISLGCIFIIHEEQHSTYTKQLVDLFIAEGLVSGHGLMYSARGYLHHVLAKLPALKNSFDDCTQQDLKIAWRYNVLTGYENRKHSKLSLGHYFDLSNTLEADALIKEKNILTACYQPCSTKNLEDNLDTLIAQISDFLLAGKPGTIQRIVIDSLFSPSWGHCRDSASFERNVLKFLSLLHILVQSTLCVVYITVRGMPSGLLHRCRHYTDYIFLLNGFDGGTTLNSLYGEYSGLLEAVQLPWVGGCFDPVTRPDTSQWAFKVKRHQFMVQHLHLPPCLSDSASRSTAVEPRIIPPSNLRTSCGGLPGVSTNIDF